MDLRNNIKRILREQSEDVFKKDIEVPNFIRRRVDFDWLDIQFNNSLESAKKKYVQEKNNLKNMAANKFASLVTSYIMVELCTKHYDLCTKPDKNYNIVWDFIKEYYYPEIIKNYYDIQYED